jgi:hypothetical protein
MRREITRTTVDALLLNFEKETNIPRNANAWGSMLLSLEDRSTLPDRSTSPHRPRYAEIVLNLISTKNYGASFQ